ncbi:C40 family peptidase [Deinococcus aerophilus]|uniref:Peptidase n=1 Tax=Deinococcus aerophilus TaxID=522488 RepID=A0ABQ2GQ69_9DEIO|nr:LysM peptidoglycan-binding domain-containing C40 family peptidase [Deinococcus aerophilus]GGM05947.1 peptidase [Deinococcus aerophilus]
MNYSRLFLTLTVAALTSTSALAATYTVKSGDTLSSIARATGTDAAQLMSLNKLSSSTIQIGQKLNLGGAAAPSATNSSTPAARSSGGAFIRSAATRFLGIRYALGGNGGNAIDCSGYTSSVFRQMGISLPRTAAGQWKAGRPVNRRDLQAGDLVFFNTVGRTASHVGVYLGDGMMANANSFHGRSMIEPLFSNPYWANRYDGARRFLN